MARKKWKLARRNGKNILKIGKNKFGRDGKTDTTHQKSQAVGLRRKTPLRVPWISPVKSMYISLSLSLYIYI